MSNELQKMVTAHKAGSTAGMYSVCSANPFVLRAALQQAKADQSYLLVEATSNQVDQFGGYTGMTPQDFYAFVARLARQENFEASKLILGGDHLGPNVWQNRPASEAMGLAKEQIAAYVSAGFTKIHLDASMALGGDSKEDGLPLKSELVADRSAELCKIAERNALKNKKPVYVIGTDIPIPGGSREDPAQIRITPVEEVREVLEKTRAAFLKKGLDEAWERVIAVVVQPGVEFGDATVFKYNRKKTEVLRAEIEHKSGMVYEAHSTDYQSETALRQMVEDHFAILKVGPWLTFALREALFALHVMEKEICNGYKHVKLSQLMETVEREMLTNPRFWKSHYSGTERQNALARKYSFSDRIRYYWPVASVQKAIDVLIKNLVENPIPLSLLSQYLPNQYTAVCEGELKNNPVDLILDKVKEVLAKYARATRQAGAEMLKPETEPEAN